MVTPITKMMGATMKHQPMRTKLYPKEGKPHIYKDAFGWNVCWVPGTVSQENLTKSIKFVDAKEDAE